MPAGSAQAELVVVPEEEIEPEVLVVASPLLRQLVNATTLVPLPPRRRIRAGELYIYIHGWLMSDELGVDAAIGLETTVTGQSS